MAVLALLAAYAVLTMAAAVRKGVSFDETEQLAVGYNNWIHHDYRMEAANGDLIKRWATLPYLVTRPNLPGTDDPAWRQGEPYNFGTRFFFRSGNQPESLLRQGRTMAMLLGLVLGVAIFVGARELFGEAGGLVALAIYVFSPSMLAFGAIVSTDISICLTLLVATWCIWRLLHRVTWGRLVSSLVICALLVLAKLSAIAIVPVTIALVALRLRHGGPLAWRLGRPRDLVSRRMQGAAIAGLFVLHVAFVWGAIWAQYEFRYTASPDPADKGIVFRPLLGVDPVGPVAKKFIGWSRQTHFLPQGMLYQTERLLVHDELRPAFMDGRWRLGGWRTFFPYAIWAKTPPAVLLLLLLSLAAWWQGRRRVTAPGDAPPPYYHAFPYVALAAIYFLVAETQKINIGHRHILPIYPPLFVLAGAAGWLWTKRWSWGRPVLVALLSWHALATIALCPDFLAYFSPAVGGSAQGYRRLVDSSLDWGMDLPELKTWLDRNNRARDAVFLAYFGTDDPNHYGIVARRLPGFFEPPPHAAYPLAPGIYAISASLVQSVYTRPFGPWNRTYEQAYQVRLSFIQQYEKAAKDPKRKAALLAQHPIKFWDEQYLEFERLRFARLCAWLRHHQVPDAEVGHAILIWRLGTADLTDAVFGPPPELIDMEMDG